MVIFDLGDEAFGVDVFEVREIIAVPDSEEYVEGIINLRGSVITLIDLAKKLHLPSISKSKDTRKVVVESDDSLIGIRVDEVEKVTKFSKDDIQTPPQTIVDKIHDEFIE